MSKIVVHAGDFKPGKHHSLSWGSLFLETPAGKREMIQLAQLKGVERASEQSVKRMAGSIGWGAVGAVALGPLGLLAGVLAGGNRKDVTFVAELRDGRKFLGTTDSKAYLKLEAAVF